MSGKGKRKDKIKPKPHEIKLFNKYIDSKRLAYDVIKYTALRFHVPEGCIAVWDGKPNDYEPDDFFFLFCMRILKHQIKYRSQCHVYFCGHYEENKLAEPRLVDELLYKVIKQITSKFPMSSVKIVAISLSIACELFLFLYSKDMALYPKKLARTWYECYLNIHKKDFENEGGLKEIYNRSDRRKCEIMDDFLGKFIEDYCLPYDTSAKNLNLKSIFDKLYFDALSQEDKEKMMKELTFLDKVAEGLPGVKYFEPAEPEGATGFNPPKSTGNPLEEVSNFCRLISAASQDLPVKRPEEQPAGATGFNPPESTGIPLDQVSQFSGSVAAAPQELPVTSHEGQPRHLGTSYLEEGTDTLFESPFEKGIRLLTLGSSPTKRSIDQTPPSVLIAPVAAQSYENQGAKPKDRVQNTGSSDLQTEPFQQSIRQSTLDSLGKQSSDKEVSIATSPAQSYENQGAKPKDRAQNTGSSDLQTEPFQQSIRQSTLDSLGKQSSDKEVSIATSPAQSYENQGAKPRDRVQNTGSSNFQTGKSSGTSGDETVE